jgi:hypothetical protein
MATEKPTDAAGKKPFLATLPGILTAIAAIITAVAGLVAALGPAGLLPGRSNPGHPAPHPSSRPRSQVTTSGDGSPVIQGVGGDVSVTVGE